MCEYNLDTPWRCGTTVRCMGKKWFYDQPKPPGSCTNVKECPMTFTALADGSPCPTPAQNQCFYPEGACNCVPCLGDGGQSSQWICRAWSAAGAGCPSPRPALGTSCAMDQQVCDYTGCCSGVPLGPSEVCKNGAWSTYMSGLCSCAQMTCK